jgi:uncharacterized protein YcbK (DUF882 family)
MKYFTIKELCKSTTANKYNIDNTPNEEIISNLTALVENVLDPLREAWGRPITVSSGYRCKALNTKVKGSSTSQHMLGQAADISAGTIEENKKLFQLAQNLKLPYDQLIDEYGYSWVHISYGPRNRRSVLHLK